MALIGFGLLLVAGKMYGAPPSDTAAGATTALAAGVSGPAAPTAAWLTVIPPATIAATTMTVPLATRTGRTLIDPSPEAYRPLSIRIVPRGTPGRKASL